MTTQIEKNKQKAGEMKTEGNPVSELIGDRNGE